MDDLLAADIVVGFNINNFDYAVLSHYANTDLSALNSLDLIEAVVHERGHRVSLDNLAQATLGIKKLHGSGLDAIRLYREGKMFDLVEYCKQDVRITKELFEYGAGNGFIYFTDYEGMKIKVPVNWEIE